MCDVYPQSPRSILCHAFHVNTILCRHHADHGPTTLQPRSSWYCTIAHSWCWEEDLWYGGSITGKIWAWISRQNVCHPFFWALFSLSIPIDQARTAAERLSLRDRNQRRIQNIEWPISLPRNALIFHFMESILVSCVWKPFLYFVMLYMQYTHDLQYVFQVFLFYLGLCWDHCWGKKLQSKFVKVLEICYKSFVCLNCWGPCIPACRF